MQPGPPSKPLPPCSSRYVFHRPLLWSDELASILFLWLAMLGAVVALRRSEHMRMTAIVGRVSPPVRAFLDVLAIAAALVFLALIRYPAYEFAHDELVITTPALEITNAWRAAALPVGSALMFLIAKLYEVQKHISITNHMWDGQFTLVNARVWRSLPEKLQEIRARNFNAAAMREREDLVKVNQNVESELTKLGLQFHRPNPELFRAAISKSGYYRKWKATFGGEAWAMLEKYAGPLV